ncbi:penicillin-binding protein 2 [Aquihabitans sp. McL0605]|uniref:penicillin-binding protein 2 n=1 Tax=Aquihabitans sp. McL0605 TaxID=3415671 RepID=UPI003CE7B01C
MDRGGERQRLGFLAVLGLSLFGALFARLWFLQVVEGETLGTEAAGQTIRTVVIPAPRGEIFDRNGVVLVGNRPSEVLSIDLQRYQDLGPAKQDALRARLVAALAVGLAPADQVTDKQIVRQLNSDRFSRYRPIPIVEDLSDEQTIYFGEQADRFPSVEVEETTVRDYPHGSLAAHVLGYVGALNDTQWKRLEHHNDRAKPYARSDEIGVSGVEASYESSLRGTPGKRVYEVDRTGKIVRELTGQRVAPRAGDDVYLSIDARVQAKTEETLRAEVEARRATTGHLGYYPAESAAAAVVDPANGQVVAMASYPTYDPSALVGGISQDLWDYLGDPVNGYPLNNRAIAGQYPPGSTFKLASAYAGLKLGLITTTTPKYDGGVFNIPGCTGGADACQVRSPSAESSGIGNVTLGPALTASSDVYFYSLGNDAWAAYKQQGRVGPDAFQHEVAKLGFGAKTGIDLPGEASGRLPDPTWLATFDKELNGKATEAGVWGSGASINLAIGQGDMLATPLQLANAYAAFANGGTLYRPSVLDRIVPNGGTNPTVTYEPKVIDKVDWGADAHAVMLDGFEGVTQDRPHATGRDAFAGFPQDAWPAAGKTGTAQTGTKTKPKEDNSLFVGFGPGTDPRYAAAVVMEHAGAGGSASAPVVRQIFETIATGQLPAVDLDAVKQPGLPGGG